jgi:hypothetical protein
MNGIRSIDAVLALQAVKGTSQSDLDAAIRDVRASVEGGQSLGSLLNVRHNDVMLARMASSMPQVAEAMLQSVPTLARAGAAAPIAHPLAANVMTRSLVNIRTSPIAEADPLAPAWTRGTKPSATRGPFTNAVGERVWIDTFLLPELVDVVAKAGPTGTLQLLARLPLKGSIVVAAHRQLAAGSVWLPSSLLVKDRPADEFVGIRVRGGVLELTNIASASGGSITLGSAWRMKLVLQLDVAANPVPTPNPGADASNAAATLPAIVTIDLNASGALAIDLGNASATAYDTTVAFARSPAPPFYDEVSRAIVVPCSTSRQQFPFATVRSASMSITGSAALEKSGWALLTVVTTPPALGEAASAGFLWLSLKGALHAQWKGLGKAALLPHIVLGIAPGSIALWATVIAGEVIQHLRLWDEPGSAPLRQSSVDVTSIAGSTVFYLAQPGSEAVVYMGKAVGHLDRPLVADGGRVALAMPIGWFVRTELPTEITAGVSALDPSAMSAPHIGFALENALVKTRPPVWLIVEGALDGDQLESGGATLFAPYRAVIPTLPDPYAANFDFERRQDVDIGWASATVTWAAPPTAVIGFSVQGADGSVFSVQAGQAAPALLASPPGARAPASFVLLDVSSNADQFGVAIPVASRTVAVQGLAVVSPARDVAVLTLPPISWEPMLTTGPSGGDPALPPPPHDGGAATMVADTTRVGPVEPISLLRTYHDAVNQRRHFTARLPLPFGLIAHLDTRGKSDAPQSTFIADGNAMAMNRPTFSDDIVGGLQLAITAPPNAIPDSRDVPLPGRMELVDDNQYSKGVLSENIHTRFGGDFGSMGVNVPVRRYDWSGYGASLFSDWRDPEAVGPAIIEARFDVLVGRTAHEVIQMQSVMHPWWIRVVRTITMDRTRGGWILREDSGWVAASDGRFAYAGDLNAVLPAFQVPAFTKPNVHAGAVEALVNVRNIRLDGAQFPLSPAGGTNAVTWQAVHFDADVMFDDSPNPRLVVEGGSSARRVPSRGITGWIQIDGPKYDTKTKDGSTISRVASASATDVFGLLAVRGPARAPLDCSLSLGGTDAKPGLVVRTSSVDVRCADDPFVPRLVAGVLGSPVLPRDGAWSLSRIGAADPAPAALAPTFPVPVVRPTAPTPGSDRWHLADQADILKLDDAANPSTRYGLVQTLGAQKVYFERPRVDNNADPITLPKPPKLADMGALLGAAGIFPGLSDAFDFQNLKALSASGGDLGFTETFPVGAGTLRESLLADLGAIQVVIEYHDEHETDVGPANTGPGATMATVTVDPAAPIRWSLLLTRVCFTVRYNKARLISIFADVKADARSAPTVVNVNVRYEGILGALQSIFTNIQQVAKFLPGGVGANLKVGFSQGHLTVRNAFALPTLPLGTGQITDIAVDMGFDVALSPFDVRFVAGLGSSQNPFRWVVSPLAGTGVVQVAIGKQGLDILVQGGLGLGLAIDLGIASGSASITLAVQLNTGPDPFEIMGILSGRASVDVLQGLASATITLAAGLGIIPPPELFKPPFLPPSLPPEEIPSLTIGLVASVSAGIHLSVCWVIDVDWEGYWQFRQDVSTPAIPIPI